MPPAPQLPSGRLPFLQRSRLHLIASFVVFAAVLAGLLFWLIFSDRFFSAYEAHPALLIPSLIVLGLVIASRPSMDTAKSIRMPTPWVRAFARPIFALFLAGSLYAVGTGWIAVISLWMARTPASVEFDVLEVRRNESRRSACLRKVQSVGPSGWHSLCADALPVQGKLAAGRRVTAIGTASPLGFHLEELRAPWLSPWRKRPWPRGTTVALHEHRRPS